MSDPLIIDTSGDEVKVEVTSPSVIARDIPTPLTGFLQIASPTNEEQKQLKDIWQYLQETTKDDLDSERLMALRHLETRLGAPRLGQTRLQQIYQYIKLDKEVKLTEKLRDSFLR